MSGYRLGPIGALREIPAVVQAGTAVVPDRPSSEWRTMSGRRIVQRAPRAMRTWSLDLGQWRAPADVAYLTALAAGAIPGPHYLYTEVAARTNLLPTDLAAPGQMGTTALAPVSTTLVPVDIPGASAVPMASANRAALGFSPRIPVLPSTQYTLSCWSTGTGSALYARMFSTSGTVGSDQHVASGSGRRSVTFTTPSNAASLSLRAQGTGAISGLRLTEGASQDAVWLPGQGVPQVVVDDPAETLQLVTAAHIAADYSITLREVG